MAGYTTSRAGRVGKGDQQPNAWGRLPFEIRGRWCFYELRSKTGANRLTNRRPHAYAHGLPFKCKKRPNGQWVGHGVDQSRVQRYNCAYEPRIGRSRPGSEEQKLMSYSMFASL